MMTDQKLPLSQDYSRLLNEQLGEAFPELAEHLQVAPLANGVGEGHTNGNGNGHAYANGMVKEENGVKMEE